MKTQVRDSSIAAYRALPVKQLATQADRIFDIVQFRTRQFAIDALCGVPRKDMSLKEIQSRYEADYFTDIELSTVSARVHALVAAGRLERLEKEIDQVSDIYSIFVPGYELSANARVTVRLFVDRLGVPVVEDAMRIAGGKWKHRDSKIFKYFCGICWNRIRELGGDA